MPQWRTWLWISLAVTSFSACQLEGDDAPSTLSQYNLETPAGFPAMPIPAGNEPTTARIDLGKRLFYDPILSRDSTVSCGSCHHQELAFTDGRNFSVGIEENVGFRNAPSLSNLAWHPYFFYDGGVPTLELQVLAPLDAHFEMDNELIEVIRRLKTHPQYPTLFRQAYGREPDPYALTRAVAAFERTLVSGDSPWDRFITGQDASAMSASQLRGWNLFQSDSLHCSSCHSGFDFTDYSFQNIGIPVTTADSGRMRITLNESDRGKYKTPSLRNIALTAPYMHDGSIATLDEVIDHFASGGQHYSNQSALAQGFTISDDEKADLIAFLNALTDWDFVQNPDFR
jgi:cytochrome c peroxidase